MNQTKDLLMKARQLIANGWTQGRARKEVAGQACYCTIGALTFATQSSHVGVYHVARDTLRDTLRELGAITRVQSLVEYNDRPDTTKEDVLAAFDLTIERL